MSEFERSSTVWVGRRGPDTQILRYHPSSLIVPSLEDSVVSRSYLIAWLKSLLGLDLTFGFVLLFIRE
jgi:hypothetical protein